MYDKFIGSKQTLQKFMELEYASGILMMVCAALALIISNTPLDPYYEYIQHIPITVKFNGVGIHKSLLHFVNEGLMAVFFLLVGLEIKREMVEGSLKTWSSRVLPGIAAVGGMVFPALFYVALNYADPLAIKGWAIPTATDIAFSLGVLSILGTRVPVTLRIFLTAIAIFDDLGAIIIIAAFYTEEISFVMLALSFTSLMLMYSLNAMNVARIMPYILLGVILWFCVLESGVHASLAGVAMAFAIPLRNSYEKELAEHLENALEPWVMFIILPVFAFFNAGVSFHGIGMHYFTQAVPLGIALGLFVGKQVGIFGTTYAAVKMKWAKLPETMNWAGVYGVSMLCGIGFTMSLFIGMLSFGENESFNAISARFGVMLGSLLSGLFGIAFLRYHFRIPLTSSNSK